MTPTGIYEGPLVVVLIPSFNEEQTIERAIQSVRLGGSKLKSVRIVVVDDGSTDGTADLARRSGADRVVTLGWHQGLTTAFRVGVETGLSMGPDAIVNFDADCQFHGEDIPMLVEPVLAGECDIMIGSRNVREMKSYGRGRRIIHAVGSRLVGRLTGLAVPDPVSGFRVFSRKAALNMWAASRFSYTLETLVYASRYGMRVGTRQVSVNGNLRPSRLFSSPVVFLARQAASLLVSFCLLYPIRLLGTLSMLVGLPGSAMVARFFWCYAAGDGQGHIQSLVLGSMCIVSSVVILSFGVVASAIDAVRRISLETRASIKFGDGGEQRWVHTGALGRGR